MGDRSRMLERDHAAPLPLAPHLLNEAGIPDSGSHATFAKHIASTFRCLVKNGFSELEQKN